MGLSVAEADAELLLQYDLLPIVKALNDLPAPELTFDHVIPRSRGGRTNWTNVVTACSCCNLMKGNRLPRECQMFPLQKPVEPSAAVLQRNGRAFPPNYLHESWRDFLYWDSELETG
mgnify:CR=1 FL=1